jgi:hypothetical protein
MVAVSASHAADPAGDEGGTRADDLCAICFATAAIGSAIAASPPPLPSDFAVAAIEQCDEAQSVIGSSQRSAFWSRGPPLS